MMYIIFIIVAITSVVYGRAYLKFLSSYEVEYIEKCDIITPLNTYTDVRCDSIVYVDGIMTFTIDKYITVEVAADTAHVIFH